MTKTHNKNRRNVLKNKAKKIIDENLKRRQIREQKFREKNVKFNTKKDQGLEISSNCLPGFRAKSIAQKERDQEKKNGIFRKIL